MVKTAAILVGGQARRLGGVDKSQLAVAGRTVLDRQLSALHTLVDRILVVGHAGSPALPGGLEAVADLWPGCGSLGGICTALRVARAPVLVLACDMPFVTTAFLAHVREAISGVDAAMPRSAGRLHPLCAAYGEACLDPMRRRIESGRLKVVDALDGLRVREIGPGEVAGFDPDGLLLMNLNTPEDFARAVARAETTGA